MILKIKLNKKIVLLLTLTLMIFLDLSFHLLELLFGISFPTFPSRTVYTYFWTAWWFFAFLLSISIVYLEVKEKK
jgi:hypothetical protein